ncbi:unannotated protein [freshwater metagenome]|jgi:hypothetical protein|uniref:Unannotated protein n=1 Tax=freshwater metagenome TaxID=449393 RepID=A0A6J7HL12_9ZZZZ|nr:hypothetical protein [Actinomycetota bacterium]
MLSTELREIYTKMADELIPNAEGMPSASEAKVPTEWIDRALEYRPDLQAGFIRALEFGKSKSPRDAIQSLNADDSEAFDCLGVLTSGAYFLNPEVKKLIGYPGQVPSPANDDIDSYSEMLAQVVERGPVFRPTVK